MADVITVSRDSLLSRQGATVEELEERLLIAENNYRKADADFRTLSSLNKVSMPMPVLDP